MPKNKMFVDSTSMPPREWLEVLDMASHNVQASLIIVAPSKAYAVHMLTERRVDEYTAKHLVKETRITPAFHPDWRQIKMLVAAEIVDPAIEGVYVFHNGVNGDVVGVVEANAWPATRIIARFGYESSVTGRGLYVERVDS